MKTPKTLGYGLAAVSAFTLLARPALADKLLDSVEGAQELSTWAWKPGQYGSAVKTLAHMELSYLDHVNKKWAYVGPVFSGVVKKAVTPSSDFHVVSTGAPGPSYSYTGVTFSGASLEADAHALADQLAAQLAHGRALNSTLSRYYGALQAGDPIGGLLETTLEAGLPDEFAAPNEPTAPGAEIALTCNGARKFDQSVNNLCFTHTFSDLPAGITAATLEIRLGAPSLACNDTISLQAAADGGTLAWSRRIGSNCLGDGVPGILAYGWGNGSVETLFLDLAALPNSDGSTTDILSLLNADERLDVRINDDTQVDYARLHLVYADPAVASKAYSTVQLEHAKELVIEMHAAELAIADTIDSLTQYPEFQGELLTAADVLAFQAEIGGNGLPAAELEIASELGLTTQEIADLTALELAIAVDASGPTVSGLEAMQKIVDGLRDGGLGVAASLPDDVLLAMQGPAIVCQGASISGGPGVEVSCGPGGAGIEILTGSGQVIMKPDPSTWGKPWSMLSPAQKNTYVWWWMQPEGLGAKIQVKTAFQTGADEFPMKASATNLGPNQFQLASDFAAMGVTTKTVQVYNNGQLEVMVQGVPADLLDGICTAMPTTLGPGSSTGWYAWGPTCPEWRWQWSTDLPIELPSVGTVLGDELVVIPDLASPTPHWFFGESELEVQGISSFTVEAIDFGGPLTLCQPSLGYASDPTARITVCGGDLSAGTTANLELYGAPPSSPTLLFVGLQSNPVPIDVLGGASLVPLPQLLAQHLVADANGGHSFPIKGGFGPLTLYLQEVILGSLTVTNAVEVQFLP